MAKAWVRRGREHLAWLVVATVLLATGTIVASGVAAAQDGSSSTTTAASSSTSASASSTSTASDEQLAKGADVFSAVCASCHQPGGVGVSGQFPPLVDNPHTADAAYVADVIKNGRSGQLQVAGVTYDGVMPAQTSVSDEEAKAVIAYIQSGFKAPAGATTATDPAAGFADGALPSIANLSWILAMLIGIGVAGLVLGPRAVARIDRLDVSWPTAWLKSSIIVVSIIVATVLIPNWVINLQAVADLSKPWPDLIAVALWGAGFGACLLVLWRADRQSRI